MTYALMAQIALSGAVVWSLICRARLMDKSTKLIVRLQHLALMGAAVFAPLVGEYSPILWAFGIAAFLLMERRSPTRDAGCNDGYVHIIPCLKVNR